MTDHLELLQEMSVALAIGLLIGIERGWATRDEAEGERTAGLRTFALTGLLGGTLGTAAKLLPEGAVLLGLGIVAYTAVLGYFRHREMVQEGTFGATTVVAGILTFALGALATLGEPIVAAAAGVSAAALLALKGPLHGWLRKLTWEELRAGLLLLAMTLILLPVLPNRGFGPYEALNPYELWLMTILISAVSFTGYIAMKWVGGQNGIAVSGLVGGLVSSTAVALSFAGLARDNPSRLDALMGGALLATVAKLGRVLFIAASINPALVRWLVLPLAFAAAATLAMAVWLFKRTPEKALKEPLKLENPFELGTALKFTAFLAVVMVAAKALTAWAGDAGAYALGAVSGIVDVDAITLSMAQMSSSAIALQTGAGVILVATAVNMLSKAALAWGAGGSRPGMRLTIGGVIGVAAGLAGFALAHLLAGYWSPSPAQV